MSFFLDNLSFCSRFYAVLFNVFFFWHFRKVGARAAGENVSPIVTVSSTTSPSGPLQSSRDGGPLSSSALTQCSPPAPGKAGANTCPVWPTKHSALNQARYHVSQTPHRRHDWPFPLYPPFPPITAQVTSNKDDSTVGVSALKICKHSSWPNWKRISVQTKMTPISFFYLFARVLWFTVWWRRGKIMWNFLWFSVPKRGWAVFYTASPSSPNVMRNLTTPPKLFFEWLSFSHALLSDGNPHLGNDCNTFDILTILKLYALTRK